ncbi:unnamed protein product [Schistosoma mattheei]|uniref:Uncharacterized protein n=1 Tax=Schistosoma mattheei TaxID=31246 RepID=A0AA85B3A8_9TREM|nr:unnamed protein product [Schistosoma mattheei]
MFRKYFCETSNYVRRKLIKTEQKQQQQRNLFPHRSIAEIGIAIGLWRKIDKMHQQIDDVKKSHEKHNHNIVKRGKRIALLQKRRSYEKMQFNKRKSDQIKVQNELNEKLKMNREKFKFLENDQKQLKINKQLTENYLNYKQKLLDHELLIQEKYQHLINLQNRTNQISEHVKQLRNQKLVKIPISMKLTNLTLDN